MEEGNLVQVDVAMPNGGFDSIRTREQCNMATLADKGFFVVSKVPGTVCTFVCIDMTQPPPLVGEYNVG